MYTKHLTPCLPVSGFTKGFVVAELLRGVLVPANDSATMVKPRHGLIAYTIAHEIVPQEMRLQAVSAFLKQVSTSITPNLIKQKSPAFLAYRGMINSAGLRDLLNNDSPSILSLYEELKPFYDSDFLFWLQYGMAQIDAGNLDEAENYLNQSLALYPNSHQTLNHLGILYLIQASVEANPAAGVAKALDGMSILRDQMFARGDHDSYPYVSYLDHVTRWYQKAGTLVTQQEWEDLRKVGEEARAKHKRDDVIRHAADNVEYSYLKRAIRVPSDNMD